MYKRQEVDALDQAAQVVVPLGRAEFQLFRSYGQRHRLPIGGRRRLQDDGLLAQRHAPGGGIDHAHRHHVQLADKVGHKGRCV